MQCYRCSNCAVNYPPHHRFKDTCPICGGATHSKMGPPDNDWQDRIEAAQTAALEKHELLGLPITTEVDKDGNPQLFVKSWDLIRGGYGSHRFRPLDEIITPAGLILEVWAWQESKRRYWVGILSYGDPDKAPGDA